MIGIDQADPKHTASATALAMEKSSAPTTEQASAKPTATDNSEPKQPQSWLQRRIQIEKNWLNWAGEQMGGWRNSSIKALPNVVVNNASNIAGAMHMISEVSMLKANNTILTAGGNGGFLDYIIRPPVNIYKSVMRNVDFKFSPKSFLNPSSYVNAVKSHLDYKTATDIDLAKYNTPAQIDAGKATLINSWQARSTVVGMTTWLLNMLLPDVKDTPEETERMSIMATNHPIRYVAERLKQAIWVPDWFTHKRQMTGLGVLIAGTCSFLGGWRNISKAAATPAYYWNKQYSLTGLISICSSIPLLFAVDNDRGYSLSGALHFLRTAVLPTTIWTKYQNTEGASAHFYAAGSTGFQLENLFMALVGGAEKDQQGNIVDHKAMREKGKLIAQKEKGEHPTRHLLDTAEEAPAQPATKVTRTADVALAMPDRHAIAKAEQREAAGA